MDGQDYKVLTGDLEKIRQRFQQIEALASNAHWTAERRWKIAELAQQGKDIAEADLHALGRM